MTAFSSNFWDQALAELQSKTDPKVFDAWLSSIRFLGFQDGVLVLGAPNELYRSWLIRNNYLEVIEECVGKLLNRDVVIELHIAPSDNPSEDGSDADGIYPDHLSNIEKKAITDAAANGSADRLNGLVTSPLDQAYSFDTFVVGESNRFAHAAAQAVAEPQSRVYNPLFIYGGVGLGKTHLMQSIGHKMRSYGAHLNVLYVSSEAFMNAFIESVAQQRMADFRNYFRNVDLLMVDDVQFFAGAEQTQIEFFHTFNTLFQSGKKIVISSDRPPKELQALEERLRSRFEWGLIVDIQPPDFETRIAILRKKSRLIGLDLSPEVTSFIAERIRSNLRKLEGALTRLSAHHQMTHEIITVDIARSLLGPFLMGAEVRKITIEDIQMAVCTYFSISLDDLTGANRSQKFARPRQIASYLCRELTECSFPDIARKFGGRDHSSIVHAHRKIKMDMARDHNIQNLIEHLLKVIREAPSLQS